ncbi:MAG: permease [Candidatus Rifleibacteriota bacterium]
MSEQLFQFLLNCWSVLGQMSPYLILGFLISGILSVFISPEWIERHLGGGRLSAVIKATLFGIPLPLCSCGVIPVAASLKKHGASKSATTSFLLSTPQTGIDSIMATWGLLGGAFAVFRPLAALITGIFGGILVMLLDEDSFSTNVESHEPGEKTSEPMMKKVADALKYGLITLPGEIAKPLVIGIIIAGIISTFVASHALNAYLNNYYLTMILMLAVGVPLYVCSTSSIPIALSFIHLGVSPGAALVFLISGPATNAAAISVVFKVLGKKSAIIYMATVIFGSLLSGIAFDALDQQLILNSVNNVHHCSAASFNLFENVSAVLMLIILGFSFYRAHQSSACCSTCCAKSTKNGASENQQSFVLRVEGMSCNNCANAVQRILLEVPGVKSAEVDLAEKKASVLADISDGEVLAKAVNDLGYKARLET